MAIWHNESEMLHVMKTELYSSVIGRYTGSDGL